MRGFQNTTHRLSTTNTREDMKENVDLNGWIGVSSGSGDMIVGVDLVESIENRSMFGWPWL